jgi:hypothetical protein
VIDQYADRPLTDDDIATMEQAARRFSGAYTGTSGSLAGYVLLLIRERRRLIEALALERARREQ